MLLEISQRDEQYSRIKRAQQDFLTQLNLTDLDEVVAEMKQR